MSIAPKGPGHDPLQLGLDVVDRLARSKARPIADTEDMGVDGKGLLTKRGVKDDVSGLSADSGERLQFLACPRNLAIVLVDQRLAECDDVLRLGVEQADGLDGIAQRIFTDFDHLARCLDPSEKRVAGNVDAGVGRLG